MFLSNTLFIVANKTNKTDGPISFNLQFMYIVELQPDIRNTLG